MSRVKKEKEQGLPSTSPPTLLLVEDDGECRKALTRFFSAEGFRVRETSTLKEAKEAVSQKFFDFILLDMLLPDGHGLSLLQDLAVHAPQSFVIVITGYGNIEDAVTAMKLGALDYSLKPVDMEKLLIQMERALRLREMEHEIVHLRQALAKKKEEDYGLVGKSKIMQEVRDLISAFATVDSTVLITGESGTGKDIVAHALHTFSARWKGPYVTLNCGALPLELMESELFGHEKGGFTGAYKKTKGKIELARGGTLFLDEIGDLPLSAQVKLLRFLDEKRFIPLGGEEPVHVDVRIIAATNKDLEKEVEKGSFRKDLFYRLNVLRISMPPLREHLEDLPLLIEEALRRCQQRYTHPPIRFSPEALQLLYRYPWPGNVRELFHFVERLYLTHPGELIRREHIRSEWFMESVAKGITIPPGLPMEEVERRHILSTLRFYRGNKQATAKALGIGLRTLYRKLEKSPTSKNSN